MSCQGSAERIECLGHIRGPQREGVSCGCSLHCEVKGTDAGRQRPKLARPYDLVSKAGSEVLLLEQDGDKICLLRYKEPFLVVWGGCPTQPVSELLF